MTSTRHHRLTPVAILRRPSGAFGDVVFPEIISLTLFFDGDCSHAQGIEDRLVHRDRAPGDWCVAVGRCGGPKPRAANKRADAGTRGVAGSRSIEIDRRPTSG